MTDSTFKQFPPVIRFDLTSTILANETESPSIDLMGSMLCAIVTTSALTLATSVSFQASVDNIAFFPVHNDASVLIGVSIKPNRYVALSAPDFASIRYIKLFIDAAEPADVVFNLAIRPSA